MSSRSNLLPLRPSAVGSLSSVIWKSAIAFVLSGSLTGMAASGDADLSQSELDAKVARLIALLGDEEFATREKAQAELEQMGLSAFDALHEAQSHDDIEIALRARYLVRSMRVTWWRNDDPPEVREILKDYGDQLTAQRKSLMERLAQLPDSAGVDALCRLVRFENDRKLSKEAALLVMTHPAPQDPARVQELAAEIRDAIGLSKRPAASWVKLYADTLTDPEQRLDDWDQLVEREIDVFTQFPERSDAEIVCNLLRWQSEQLREAGREEESLDALRRTFDMLTGSREQLLDSVNWLIDRQLWTLVEELAERFRDRFEQSPQLLYRLAEASRAQGDDEKASQIAARALALNAEEPRSHIEVAVSLRDRGLIDWAENEFRHVISLGPAGSPTVLFAQSALSEMLHDQGRSLAAAEVLEGAIEAIDKDPAILERYNFSRSAGSWRSRYHYFYSLHFAETENRDKQKEHLRAGAKADPTDADVLIAMHRLPDADDAWRKETSSLIAAAADHYRREAAAFQRDLERFREQQNAPLIESLKSELATSYNQLAWLIGNTEGDYDEAIRASRRSLELKPDYAAFLDTLARCYFTAGDLDNAIKHQQRAIELEPHSGQTQAQLQLFLQAKEKKAEAGATD